MNKKILKSNSAFVLIGDKLPLTLSKDRGRLFSLIQGCQFSIQTERQKLKSIGTNQYIVNDLVRAPSVDLNLQYYLTPYLNNELLMGFCGSGNNYEQAFDKLQGVNQNFYVMMEKDSLYNGFDEIIKQDPGTINFSGFDVISFGNAYLKKYSLNFAVGNVPTVDVSFSCSNLKFDNLTNNTLRVPSLSTYGQEDNKTLNLSELYLTIASGYVSGNPEGRNEFNPPLANPMVSNFYLDDLQMGGIDLNFNDKPILRSFSLEIDIPRNDLYGLGNNHPFDRKIQYPINATINISTYVSGFNTGSISKMSNYEEYYGFSINFNNERKYSQGFYSFKKMRLESFNYNLNINNILEYNATFNCSITRDSNFLISRRYPNLGNLYHDIPLKWSKFDVIWSELN